MNLLNKLAKAAETAQPINKATAVEILNTANCETDDDRRMLADLELDIHKNKPKTL